jgi:hypothetical protein
MQDVRQPEYLYNVGVVNKSLKEIALCIEKHRANCGIIGTLTSDDTTGKKASHIVYGMGWTQANPYVIIDFEETSPEQTRYVAYTAIENFKWHGYVDEFFEKVNACGQCPE